MNPIYNTFRPEGFVRVSSHLFVEGATQLIDFLKLAFYDEESQRTLRLNSDLVRNCILKIGDSCLMITGTIEDFEGMKTSLYLFTEDVDALQSRALKYGSKEIFPPADMDYGDRQGDVIDPAGNNLWISKRLKNVGYDES